MKTRLTLISGTMMLVAAGVVSLVVVVSSHDARPHPKAVAESTVTVIRGDLIDVQKFAGNVGYGTATPVAGSGGGIITGLPSIGKRFERGDEMYRVNDAPITLFFGHLPLYRPLQAPRDKKTKPLQGNDVDLVARNLKKLGFWNGPTEDVPFSRWLAYAVKRWQRSQKAPATGVVSPASVYTARGPLRVAGVLARPGTTSDQDILTVTSLDTVMTVKASVSNSAVLRLGKAIEVRPANSKAVPCVVRSIGNKVTDTDDQAYIPVTVRPVKDSQAKNITPGPITASVVISARRNVLTVPATALLALAGGGFALEKTDGRLTPVNIGAVIDGAAEITGAVEGMRVVIAR